jgi:hypothetical protein
MQGVISAQREEQLPVFRIEPTARGGRINFRELWAYRELLYFLVWRDVKVRYKQTVIGMRGLFSSRS